MNYDLAHRCPKCRDLLQRVECANQWSKHFVCWHCGVIFSLGFGQLVVCQHPSEHIKPWPPAILISLVTRPPVIAGPRGMGLL